MKLYSLLSGALDWPADDPRIVEVADIMERLMVRAVEAGEVVPRVASTTSWTVGCSGVTAWRRLRDWTEAGIWPRLHEVLLTELRAAGLLDMNDAAIDGSHIRTLKRGTTPGLRRSIAHVRAASTT